MRNCRRRRNRRDASKLLMALVVEALDCGFLDGPVHPLDLPIRPRMLRLGQPMVNVVLRAAEFKGMGAEGFSSGHRLFDLADGRAAGPRRRELDAIVGKHCMDFVGHCRDKMAKEIGGDFRRSLLVQLDEGEFRGPVDGDKEMELAFFGSHFGDVDMEEAEWIGLELLFRGLAPFGVRQLADAVAPQTAMQGGSG